MIPSQRRVNADPRNPAFYQNPYQFYNQQRKHALFFWQDYEMWCLGSFKGVNSLLRDRRFARNMPKNSDKLTPSKAPEHLQHFRKVEQFSLLNLEGHQHTRIRSLVNHAFVSRQVKSLAPQIEHMALKRLRSLRPRGRANLLPEYATPLPAGIIATMLGVPERYIPRLLEWSHAMVKVYTLVQSHQDELDADCAAKEFSELLFNLIELRRAQPEEDLLTHLVNAKIEGQSLTDAELVSTAVLLLNAGHEATVHQAGNGIKCILESGLDPEQMFATKEQTEKTIRETMRFDAPLHLFTRFALQDVELDNIKIQKGEQIGLLLGAANRDENQFLNAHTFDPWRTDGNHVSLGAGVHFCIGAQLARLELEISLPLVFSQLPGLYFTEKPMYKDAFHFHGLEALELGWESA